MLLPYYYYIFLYYINCRGNIIRATERKETVLNQMQRALNRLCSLYQLQMLQASELGRGGGGGGCGPRSCCGLGTYCGARIGC